MRVIFRCDPALVDRIPRPRPARSALPNWLRDMPAESFSETHGLDIRTVKQCPPFVDAMSYGFVMPLVCDVEAHKGKLSWNWNLPSLSVDSHPRSPLSFHVPAQTTGTPFHDPCRAIVKFNSFWTIELEAGYSLFATHPVNRADLPFRLLTGLVDFGSIRERRHSLSRCLDRSGFHRRVACRHPGRAMLPGRAGDDRSRLRAFFGGGRAAL